MPTWHRMPYVLNTALCYADALLQSDLNGYCDCCSSFSISLQVARSTRLTSSLACVPATTSAMERHEGRHSCAYDSDLGFRAVGVGYNLDDKSEDREREMRTIIADWDKVGRIWTVGVGVLLSVCYRLHKRQS